MDSDTQVATEVRMYGCNLNLMKLLLNESLDKVGASMYGNYAQRGTCPKRLWERFAAMMLALENKRTGSDK